jgi:hypothetical protein
MELVVIVIVHAKSPPGHGVITVEHQARRDRLKIAALNIRRAL